MVSYVFFNFKRLGWSPYLPVSPQPKGFIGLKCFKPIFSPDFVIWSTNTKKSLYYYGTKIKKNPFDIQAYLKYDRIMDYINKSDKNQNENKRPEHFAHRMFLSVILIYKLLQVHKLVWNNTICKSKDHCTAYSIPNYKTFWFF